MEERPVSHASRNVVNEEFFRNVIKKNFLFRTLKAKESKNCWLPDIKSIAFNEFANKLKISQLAFNVQDCLIKSRESESCANHLLN